MEKFTYVEFKSIFDSMPFNSEYEFYFKGTDRTYSLVKYKDSVSICRCGYSIPYPSELFVTDLLAKGSSVEELSTNIQSGNSIVVNSISEIAMGSRFDVSI